MMARILVIDDSSEVRRVIQQALEYAGHEAVGAENGWKGLVWFRRSGADLVILDVSAGELEGQSAIDEIRMLAEQVKILALSSRAAPLPDRLCRPATLIGADDVLTKPFALLDLLVAVEGLLPGHRHRKLVVAS
jgi:DNA-binding response OmpR family regulator